MPAVSNKDCAKRRRILTLQARRDNC